jgi:hypothetical protein
MPAFRREHVLRLSFRLSLLGFSFQFVRGNPGGDFLLP